MSTPTNMSPLFIAQLTDPHVVVPGTDEELFVDNNERLASAVNKVNSESPRVSAVLATGDLTNWGHPAEYEALASLLQPLAVPVLPIPGNHDDRALMRAAFPDIPWVDASHASWSMVIEGAGTASVRIVGLDSSMPDEPGAEFDAEREEWLRSTLRQQVDAPTILAIHHPPFITGIAWMDGSGFAGLDRLEAVLTEYPVDQIACGHLHRPITSSIAGIPAQVGLSTVQHIDLDLSPDAGVSLIHEPVGYQILRISDSGIVVHTRYTESDESPFVPKWAAEF
jgi:3',5'-cyclic AMP phosphodiesterase CpdA